ncbi:MAG: hypothetical protein FWG68_06070 [Defluviitaleaceae bacterium]|nr:hypothetical protein [Defluviitaleaceae bacterium]
MNRLKESFSNMSDGTKSFLLYAYFAGMAYFVVVWVLGFDIFELSVVLGLFSALAASILQTAKRGGEVSDNLPRFTLVRSVLVAFACCYFLVLVQRLAAEHVGSFAFEPVSFGVGFAAVRMGGVWVCKRLRTVISGFKGE